MPELLGRTCLHGFAKFLSGRGGVDVIDAAPVGEAGVVLQEPLTSLWTTFLGVHLSMNQDRRSEFSERFHMVGILILSMHSDFRDLLMA